MADLEQINDLAQETPDKNDSPSKWKGKLKLHRFLVYFGLWVLAVIYLVTGARLLNSGVYDIFPQWLYEKYPGLKVVNIVSGLAHIALGAGIGIICVRLAKFRKGAPDQLTTILGVCLIVTVIYVATVSVIARVSIIRYGDSILMELLIDAVLIGILAAYYDARKGLFQK